MALPIVIPSLGGDLSDALNIIYASGDYVLQPDDDDDDVLENNSIEQLLNCLKMVGSRAAIAPAYFKMNTNISLKE